MHVRACESEGTAFVVVVSGMRFEFFFCFFLHLRAHESEGTAYVVVVSGTRFESFFFFFFGLHVRARTGIYNIYLIYIYRLI